MNETSRSVRHFCIACCAGADPIQRGYHIMRHNHRAAASQDLGPAGVFPNYGNRPDSVEGQDITLVFKQDNCFLRGLTDNFAVIGSILTSLTAKFWVFKSRA